MIMLTLGLNGQSLLADLLMCFQTSIFSHAIRDFENGYHLLGRKVSKGKLTLPIPRILLWRWPLLSVSILATIKPKVSQKPTIQIIRTNKLRVAYSFLLCGS